MTLEELAALDTWGRLDLVDEVVRLRTELESVAAERDRLQRACDEGLPREVIPCPACKAPHVEGPRHDDPTKDGRTRPHHTHRCYGCGHVWESGRWTFGVAPGDENDATKRLRADGVRAALAVVQECNREAYEMHRGGFVPDGVSGTLASWTDSLVRDVCALLPESEATDEHNAAVLRAHAEGRAAGLREALDACGDVKVRLLDTAMDGGGPVACPEAFGEEDPLDADGGECELIAAGASLCAEAIEALMEVTK